MVLPTERGTTRTTLWPTLSRLSLVRHQQFLALCDWLRCTQDQEIAQKMLLDLEVSGQDRFLLGQTDLELDPSDSPSWNCLTSEFEVNGILTPYRWQVAV